MIGVGRLFHGGPIASGGAEIGHKTFPQHLWKSFLFKTHTFPSNTVHPPAEPEKPGQILTIIRYAHSIGKANP